MDNCTNKGNISVNGLGDDNPIDYTQAYVGGVFGWVTKSSVINNIKNSASVSLTNVHTTNSAYSYAGGLGSYYKGTFTLSNSSNTGTVNVNVETPMCVGGLMGAFNGTMTGCRNSGKVNYSSSYVSDYDNSGDKKPEIGGLVGYANAEFIDCVNTGTVVCAADDGFVGGFVGGFGDATKTWRNCTVDCSIESDATIASVLGRFRVGTNRTITLGATDEPFVIEGDLNDLPVLGADCGTGNQVVFFEE